jgi:outer membrane immunogenic protein
MMAAGSAFAADLPFRMPVKAPPNTLAAPVAYIWTGCSIGGHVGTGLSRNDFSDPSGLTVAPPGETIKTSGRAGFLAGVQAGCDYQFAGNWVIGIGGDISWANIGDHANDPFFQGKNGGPIPLTSKTDALASVTGRIGYALDNVLLYTKGGAAWAHDRYSVSNLSSLGNSLCFTDTFVACNSTATSDRLGWTVGVGLEWAVAPNWTVLAEYDHYGFSNKTLAFSDPNATDVALLNVKQSIDVVKIGINYRWSLASFGRD